jgi:hypothetical protein
MTDRSDSAAALQRLLGGAFSHWTEAVLVWALAMAGVWFLSLTIRFGGWLPLVLGAAFLLVSAIAYGSFRQRMRFRSAAGGPGIVRVVEGRIGYLGPVSGGFADADSLEKVEIGTRRRTWMLYREGEPPLEVPLGASGAEALFDAVAALPGARMAEAERALEIEPGPVVLVWEKPRHRLAG